MSAKTPYCLTKGEVRGLYGCGFHWWISNPKNKHTRQDKPHIYMRFQGVHNITDVGHSFFDSQVHAVLLGKDGYLQRLWRHDLENAVKPAAAVLDIDKEISQAAEHVRCIWTPYDSLAQALDDTATTGWYGAMRRCDRVKMQLGRVSHVLEKQKDVKVFIARHESKNQFHENTSVYTTAWASLLLFEPWQWASFHATLYSLCAPFMDNALIDDLRQT